MNTKTRYTDGRNLKITMVKLNQSKIEQIRRQWIKRWKKQKRPNKSTGSEKQNHITNHSKKGEKKGKQIKAEKIKKSKNITK